MWHYGVVFGEKNMPKKFLNTKLSETAFAELTFLAKATNMKKSRLLEELLGAVFDIACQYQTLNIMYTGDFTGAWLKLNFVGRSNIELGTEKVKGESSSPIVKIIKVKEKEKHD